MLGLQGKCHILKCMKQYWDEHFSQPSPFTKIEGLVNIYIYTGPTRKVPYTQPCEKRKHCGETILQLTLFHLVVLENP